METSSKEILSQLLKDLVFVMECEDTGKVLGDNLPEQLKSFYTETLDLVNNEKFDYLSQFQDTVDALFDRLICSFEIHSSEFEQVCILKDKMTRLINSLYEHVGDRGVYQGDKLDLNGLVTRKGLGKDEKKRDLEEKKLRQQKYALLQKMPDGTFIFTSSMKQPFLDHEKIDINGLQKVRISVASTQTQKLGSLAAGSKSATSKPTSRLRAVKFLKRGAFDSFAPSTDSSDATLSVTESLLCSKRKFSVFYEDSSINEVPVCKSDIYDLIQNVNNEKQLEITDEMISDFKKDGIDIELLLKDQSLVGLSGILLKENQILLRKLQEYQDKRYRSGSEITDKEYEIAKKLERQLRILVDQTPPSDVMTQSTLKAALIKLQIYSPGYKGTLPSSQPFSYYGNTVGQLPFLYMPGTKKPEPKPAAAPAGPPMMPPPQMGMTPSVMQQMRANLGVYQPRRPLVKPPTPWTVQQS